MKRMILFGLTAVVLFGVSAAISYMLRGKAPEAASKEASATALTSESEAPSESERGSPAALAPDGSARVAVRTKYVPEAEVAVQLASSLRDREAALKQRETRLTNRESHVELVFKDIQTERVVIDEMRKRVQAELQATEAQMAAVKEEHEKLSQQKKKVEQQVSELESHVVELQGAEQTNIKKMAETYGLMDPDKAAKILQEMVEAGKTETAIKILAFMTQRQAARVFAELPQKLAGELIDRLKDFKPLKPGDKK